jgi:hypothetical protein
MMNNETRLCDVVYLYTMEITSGCTWDNTSALVRETKAQLRQLFDFGQVFGTRIVNLGNGNKLVTMEIAFNRTSVETKELVQDSFRLFVMDNITTFPNGHFVESASVEMEPREGMWGFNCRYRRDNGALGMMAPPQYVMEYDEEPLSPGLVI